MTTLPGTITGLLRRGSPVILHVDGRPEHLSGRKGTVNVVGAQLGLVSVAVDRESKIVLALSNLVDLDLEDVTGRWHAWLWWKSLVVRVETYDIVTTPYYIHLALSNAQSGAAMVEDDVNLLRRYLLAVAWHLEAP